MKLKGIPAWVTIFACHFTVNGTLIASAETKPAVFTDAALATQLSISPDGQYVAYTVRRRNQNSQGNYWTYNLEIKNTENGKLTQSIYSSTQPISQPKWSKDSQSVAYIQNQDAQSNASRQILTYNLKTGRATQATRSKAGIINFNWQKNGSGFLFTSAEQIEGNSSVKSPLDKINISPKEFRVRLYQQESVNSMPMAISDPDISVLAFDESPNSKSIAVLATSSGDTDDIVWHKEASLINMQTKETRKLSRQKIAYDCDTIQWAPDADEILTCLASSSGIGTDFAILSTDSSKVKYLAKDKTYNIYSPNWNSNTKLINAVLVEDNKTYLAIIDPESDSIRSKYRASFDYAFAGQAFSTSEDGKTITYLNETPARPAEIHIKSSSPMKKSYQISNFNPKLNEIRFGEMLDLEWESEDGLKVKGLLILPPNYNPQKRFPLITVLHGGPRWMWWHGWQEGYMGWGQFLATNGYITFLPNFRGSFGRGDQFSDLLIEDWGGGDFKDVQSGIDYVLKHYSADADRLGIGGFSYGGFLTLSAITQTDRFKAAVAGGVISNLHSFYGTTDMPSFITNYFPNTDLTTNSSRRFSPVKQSESVATPVLLYSGLADLRAPFGQAQEMYQALKANAVPTQLVGYPNQDHYFKEKIYVENLMERVLAWYRKYL